MTSYDTDESREWDERYRGDGDDAAMWSGHANGSLVAEVADLAPGTALDVGCGEGSDAVWLASLGWQVTALDPSSVALARARQAAQHAEVEIRWVHGGLVDVAHDLGRFDLVTAQYPAILKRTGDDGRDPAVVALLDAVATGGTLLVVHHDVEAFTNQDHEGAFDPHDYVQPADLIPHLDPAAWRVEVNEVRDRPGPLSPKARHVRDVVLRAVRTV